MRIIILALALLAVVPACAHDRWANGDPIPSWVKAQCCGPNDVHHLTPEMVHGPFAKEGTTEQYYLVDGYQGPINAKIALPSQDGDYWIFYQDSGQSCTPYGGCFSHSQSSIYCFFIPMAM